MRKIFLFFIVFVGAFFSASCTPGEPKNESPETLKENAAKKKEYLKKGKEIAQASVKVLGGTLKAAIAAEGIEGAIRTCNVHANPIVDSLSKEYNATIKRTSLRIRNQENKPTANEKHILKLYQRAQEAGEDLMPIVILDSNWVTFYSPIITKPLCLNCHGEPELRLETIELLEKMYPGDKAYSYKLDEIRGMWSIKFKDN